MPLVSYISLSAVLFVIGVMGVLLKRNVLTIFMSIELMLNAVNVALAAFARHHGGLDGQIFVFFVMAVAAAEAAVGLAIFIAIFRLKQTTDVTEINLMRW
ncbi:MAG: NADH-quinone oxidoreductase subunit NuoK [Acidobacteria bacterium]|nr:NADH-quinone oxidoreductase subunit NuoK [Acidobacteriota bacterium]